MRESKSEKQVHQNIDDLIKIKKSYPLDPLNFVYKLEIFLSIFVSSRIPFTFVVGQFLHRIFAVSV